MPGAKNETPEPEAQCLCGAPSPVEMLTGYYNRMVEPQPFVVRSGEEFRQHQAALRSRILTGIGLSPLPERIPLDVEETEPLEHPWGTVRGTEYSLWRGVRSRAFLYRPLVLSAEPSPAVLCPVGHWPDGNTHPDVQIRCFNLARLGYTVLCTTQNHYEDLTVGISHQTLMVWNNMRALDLLQSLPEVDNQRIGCAGCSGGGLQTQMLAALDERVVVASIVGITCDYREILFPYRSHCACNHWPGVMQYTDQPEIAAMALPRPVQFLTMDDWTHNFQRDNLPRIKELYEANGVAERLDHQYWPTPHTYDRAKRERTYQWMERWLRGRESQEPPPEPETESFPPSQLQELLRTLSPGEVTDGESGFEPLSAIYEPRARNDADTLSNPADCTGTEADRGVLKELLGLEAELPRTEPIVRDGRETHEGLVVERVAFPSEGPLQVPSLLLRKDGGRQREVKIICDDRPKEERKAASEACGAAGDGALICLPDVRFVGALSLEQLQGRSKERVSFRIAAPSDEQSDADYVGAWTRNGILWGRPLPGMTVTDLIAVLDGLGELGYLQDASVHLFARGTVALGAQFAADLDDRIDSADIEFNGKTIADRSLPLVPDIARLRP